jgi:hypothetical protein
MNQDQKPTPRGALIDSLGPKVELTTEALEKDHDANNILHRIGQEKAEPGMNYVGTICIHMYAENEFISKTNYSIANITNIAMKRDMSESFVAACLNNATIAIRQYFNPSFTHKSTNKRDKRGSVK